MSAQKPTQADFLTDGLSAFLHGYGSSEPEIAYVTKRVRIAYEKYVHPTSVDTQRPARAMKLLANWMRHGEGRLLLELATCELELYRLRGEPKESTDGV